MSRYRYVVRRAAVLMLSAVTAACDRSGLPITPTGPSVAPVSAPSLLAGTEIYLSDLTWTSMKNGWGPVERDRSNSERGDQDGQSITLDGETYAKGLGTHAHSEIAYALNGACSTFAAYVGVDDEVGLNGSVRFEVWTDGTKLYNSDVVTGATAIRPIIVDITGKNTLTLITTDAGDGKDFDHADWADARVTCSDDSVARQ